MVWLRRYTGLTIEIENSDLMNSFACGSCGESLFDHQFASPRKQCNRAFRGFSSLLLHASSSVERIARNLALSFSHSN